MRIHMYVPEYLVLVHTRTWRVIDLFGEDSHVTWLFRQSYHTFNLIRGPLIDFNQTVTYRQHCTRLMCKCTGFRSTRAENLTSYRRDDTTTFGLPRVISSLMQLISSSLSLFLSSYFRHEIWEWMYGCCIHTLHVHRSVWKLKICKFGSSHKQLNNSRLRILHLKQFLKRVMTHRVFILLYYLLLFLS